MRSGMRSEGGAVAGSKSRRRHTGTAGPAIEVDFQLNCATSQPNGVSLTNSCCADHHNEVKRSADEARLRTDLHSKGLEPDYA